MLIMLFSRFDKLSATKNTNSTFFESEEVFSILNIESIPVFYIMLLLRKNLQEVLVQNQVSIIYQGPIL